MALLCLLCPIELWDVEATIHFTDPDNFRHAVRAFFKDALDHDSLCNHTILDTGFLAKTFVAIDFNEEDPLILRHIKLLYLKSLSLLILTIARSPYEVASRQIVLLLDCKLIAINCDKEIVPTRGAKRVI
jgi:hypothetical protein